MAGRLIIDGNAVYEIDEECMGCREKRGTGAGMAGEGRKRGNGTAGGLENGSGQQK